MTQRFARDGSAGGNFRQLVTTAAYRLGQASGEIKQMKYGHDKQKQKRVADKRANNGSSAPPSCRFVEPARDQRCQQRREAV